jgi:Domain of unknown function (DUF4157)
MKATLQKESKTSSSAQPSFTTVPGGVLQRKCACGGMPGPTGECEACRKKKLQRRSENLDLSSITHPPSSVLEVPPIVHEVLRSPGQPLGTETRAFMEPRFGHDFSQVRVHTGRDAAKSADAVHAHAFTVGQDMVFGAGQYLPGSRAGTKLLAHELTHVVQQQASPATVLSRASSPTDSSEIEARQASQAVGDGHSVQIGISLNHRALQLSPLYDPIRVFESVLPIVEQALPTNHAGEELKDPQKTAIAKMPSIGGGGASGVSGKPESRFFVVHDTAADITAAEMTAQDKKPRSSEAPKRGPLGVGYSLVPRSGDFVAKRKTMFEQDRPTATAWEKAEDKIDAGKRVQLMHQVWAGLDSTQRSSALEFAKAKFGLTDDELKQDKQFPVKELDPASKCIPNGKEPCIHTLAQWAVERACDTKPWASGPSTQKQDSNVKPAEEKTSDPAAKAGEDDVAKKLEAAKSACEALDIVFKSRAERIPFTTNVEVRQIAKAPFPTPIYTKSQYDGVKNLYLKAAAEAGFYPHITTHFWVDRDVLGHTDPRCFNMHKLFKLISKALSFKEGDRYGDEPKYGAEWTKHNVWWDKDACREEHP